MAARRLLITAGPTHEPIDAVRYIGNRSSGRMGLALAEAGTALGMHVTLLLGPCDAGPDSINPRVRLVRFRTSVDLEKLLREEWPAHDVLIMAAAVADFRPRSPNEAVKLKRGKTGITIDLEPTPDLLAMLAPLTRSDQITIGFALEPAERLMESAREKLHSKRLTAIVANPLETIGSESIDATVLLADGRTIRPSTETGDADEPTGGARTKRAFAQWLLGRLDELHAAAGRAADRTR